MAQKVFFTFSKEKGIDLHLKLTQWVNFKCKSTKGFQKIKGLRRKHECVLFAVPLNESYNSYTICYRSRLIRFAHIGSYESIGLQESARNFQLFFST